MCGISWVTYHASRQEQSTDLPAITALFPLFNEKSDSPAMAKYAMKIMQEVTEFLNPGQIPVIAGDCPIFSTCKYVQWKYPDTHGYDARRPSFRESSLDSTWKHIGWIWLG